MKFKPQESRVLKITQGRGGEDTNGGQPNAVLNPQHNGVTTPREESIPEKAGNPFF